MSKLKVIRASAGSGKTYKITAEYLRLLFRYPRNYKHILAVTFTNKATEEMKIRILGELHKLAAGLPSGHGEYLSKEFNLSDIELAEKAQFILNNILHNYSRFSVSTIDTFFQRIIKSFAREAGLQYNFDVELDTNDVLEKAADNMLKRLSEDKTLLDWLVQFAEERIEDGKKWDFKEEILKLGKQLFNEHFKSFPASFHEKLKNRKFLKEFRTELNKQNKAFEAKLLQTGIDGLALISKHGLQPDGFKWGKNGGVGMYFQRLSKGNTEEPSKRIIDAAETVENWLPKEKELASVIQTVADAGLYALLQEVVKFYSENVSQFQSYKEVLKSFYTLGLLSDLAEEIEDYTSEKNIFLLANASTFLKTIIGENDAPFIYEKAGQVYHHFMIDEFQDTSEVQWHNFRPLINNSLSEQHLGMVVGDVKQSIYRWRSSDWKIMAHQLETDVDEHGVKFDNLDYNWRSKSNIIAFNNTFFSSSAKLLQHTLSNELPEGLIPEEDFDFLKRIITTAYDGCEQKLPSGKALNEGYVKIEFIHNEENDWDELVLEKLPPIIKKLQYNGQSLRDIAVLVRSATEGRAVVDYLNAYRDKVPSGHPYKYDVLSNESAFLKNADVVALIIKLFTFLDRPEDTVNAASLAYDYLLYSKQDIPKIASDSDIKLFDPLQILPKEFISNIEKYKNLPVGELFEQLIMLFGFNHDSKNLPYVQALNDCIADYNANNPSGLAGFLEYWEENQYKLSVSVSENQDAIRVMTIHKSKGLEFANVIIPFCNWSFDYKPMNQPTIWCASNQPPFNQLEYLPVRYSSNLSKTIFAPDYFLEKSQSLVDNLNLLYVAFTRVSENLFVFAPTPTKADKISSTGEVLYSIFNSETTEISKEYPLVKLHEKWKKQENLFEYGSIAAAKSKENEHANEFPLENFASFEIKEKLRQKYTAADFWQLNNENQLPKRAYGNLMHRLFQEIKIESDVEKAVETMILNGWIQKEEQTEIIKEVNSVISQKPYNEWFNGSWEVMNEPGIIIPNEPMHRPDRVMKKDNQVLVIDYKFGRKQNVAYNYQVKQYMEFVQQMGATHVQGLVWYVNMNLVDKVE